MRQESIDLLKNLLESFGPAGFERETAQIVKNHVTPYADEVTSDKLGTVIFKKRGTQDTPRILLAGHMDEVGFVISGIDDSGFLTFNPLGGWFDQVLLSQRVTVRTKRGDLLGLVASKPPHLLTPDEQKQIVTKDKMYIDIGTSTKKESEDLGVRIGDPAIPWSPFTLIQNGRLALGKAFDDRIGAFIAIEAVKKLKEEAVFHPNTVYGAATVQEEVGLRGAQTVAHVVDPDAAIVLEVDISGDVPGIKSYEAPCKVGKGPTILTFDASMIPNQPFKEFMIDVAEKHGIPYQLSQVSKGGTDAGRIHLNRAGCPSIVVGVATRHIHSHAGILSIEDTENAIKLTVEAVRTLDGKTVDSFTQI